MNPAPPSPGRSPGRLRRSAHTGPGAGGGRAAPQAPAGRARKRLGPRQEGGRHHLSPSPAPHRQHRAPSPLTGPRRPLGPSPRGCLCRPRSPHGAGPGRGRPRLPAGGAGWYGPLPWWRRRRAGGGSGGSMAALARLRARLPALREECFRRNRCVDEDRKIKYKAAVKIQSWFRGCRVRAYLRHLNKMVICIQKRWRGYQSRRYFRKIVKIQKRWRGYYVRKYIHNYYALKKYLEAVSVNNEIVRNELQEYAEMNEKEKKKKDQEKKEKEKEYQARKMHYLLSTEQIAGIYNSPFRKSPDPMELLLRQSKPLSHRRQQVKSPFRDELYDWPTCTRPPTFHAGESLPPIGRQKPQGPFRDTAEVLRQRYMPLEPTLRVAASIDSPLEKARVEMKRGEWRNHIHDNEFLPFSSYHKNEKYDLSIHRSGKYGQETYGIKHFREVQPNKWVTGKDFQTVLPSIVLFEKFGKTYSRCGQIV
uniref:Spermatosis associated 17 n=1 Tax=Anser brachyrhynchus TaxID=132585 RepID=A0A8B9CFI1_9AVES